MTFSPGTDMELFEKDVRNCLAYIKGYSPDDDQAVYVSNIEAQTSNFESLFKGLNILIWVIGICFVLSGAADVITYSTAVSELASARYRMLSAKYECIFKQKIQRMLCHRL